MLRKINWTNISSILERRDERVVAYFGVRLGTWVTIQTGHIGYTLRVSFDGTAVDLLCSERPLRGASALAQVARQALSMR